MKNKYIFGDIPSGRLFCLNLDEEKEGLRRVHELDVSGNLGSIKEWAGNRVELRIGEDAAGELYIMSKSDAKIRKIIDAK